MKTTESTRNIFVHSSRQAQISEKKIVWASRRNQHASGMCSPEFAEFETRSLPALTHSYPRHFTFYVAHPIRSI
jgi:hypothetical protein